MKRNASYLLKRASIERTAALNAPDPRVRAAHSKMAERYEDLVRAIARSELLRTKKVVSPRVSPDPSAEPTSPSGLRAANDGDAPPFADLLQKLEEDAQSETTNSLPHSLQRL